MSKVVRRALQVFALIAALVAVNASAASAAEDEGRYIVVFKDSVAHPGNLANAQVDELDGDMTSFYSHALDGYAATLPSSEVSELRQDPRVEMVTVDHQVSLLEEEIEIETFDNGGVELFEATLPTGIQRSYASTNKALDIDGVDDLRADVDVAVIDTGVDNAHSDLNVAGRTNCETGTCVDNTGTDIRTHGTHVAGTVGAIDNGAGVVGVAPGARMWGVKVFADSGPTLESQVTAGVDWVKAHASTIEVANMSLGCGCPMTVLEEAINATINAGVVFTVSAGNNAGDAKFISPAKDTNVITVSALADYDGKPGAKAASTCENYGLDDRLASFSNYGTVIDIVAPGVCTLSTTPANSYGYKSGTSMAAPHVAGAAAIRASLSNPNSKADVEAIRNTIVAAGNAEWTDTSGDSVKEPLLDLSNESTFKLEAHPPANTVLPVVSPATPEWASSESTTTGSWNNKPTSYAYQWQRCNAAGAECANISGATKSTYSLVEADIAKTLVVKVTATNAAGSTSAFSKATGKVPATGQIVEYALPEKSVPILIASGPDGNLWFTNGGTGKVGKITTSGSVTEYAVSEGNGLVGIAAGPDGNLWFTNYNSGKIGKITTSGAITEYALPSESHPGSIVAGPDGKLWFTNGPPNKIGKITTTGTITEYALPKESRPETIAAGPDGNLWFTTLTSDKVGKITTAGTITEYALPKESNPGFIAAGPDGKLWFANNNKIGKITTTGTITEYALSKEGAFGIAAGPDGNMWFTNGSTSKIGRITTSGTITEFPLPASSGPLGITAGPDSKMWFTNVNSKKIGKITP